MTTPAPDAPADVPTDGTPPIPEPVWHEYTRTITVQAYKVSDAGERVITVSGLQDVGPDNYVVNDGGFLDIVDATSFEALYPSEVVPTKK